MSLCKSLQSGAVVPKSQPGSLRGAVCIDTYSQVRMQNKLAVQAVNHMRRAGRTHTWTGNTDHRVFWWLCCSILKSACCTHGGRGQAWRTTILRRPVLPWASRPSKQGFSQQEDRAAFPCYREAWQCHLGGACAPHKPVSDTSAALIWGFTGILSPTPAKGQ